MAAPYQQTALSHREAQGRLSTGLKLEEMGLVGKLVLRSEEAILKDLLKTVFKLALPAVEEATSDKSGEHHAIWMAPDEVMVLLPYSDLWDQKKAVEAAIGDRHAQVVNVSDYYTMIEMAGFHASDATEKLTPYNIRKHGEDKAWSAATIMAKVPALIHCPLMPLDGGGRSYRFLVRWSHADFLWCMLADAGFEYGLTSQKPYTDEILTID